MRLTVCVIARDEEASLPVTLDSVQEMADEIVIVDTGSSDSTLTIAKRYTEKVFVHPRADEWREHPNSFRFDEARNYALSQCTGDWILSLDCDETISEEAAPKIKPLLSMIPEHVELLLVHILMLDDNLNVFQQFLGERLIRNGRGITFVGGMHNTLSVPVGPERAEAPQIEIMHDRRLRSAEARAKRGEQRLAMAEEVFCARIASDPNDRRALFYLAGTYYDAGRLDEAIPLFARCLEVSDWREERYQAALLVSRCYFEKGDYDKARKVMAVHLPDNTRRAEGEVMLGRIAKAEGDISQAEWWFKAASLKPCPIDPLFVEPSAHTWEPHAHLWDSYVQMNDYQRAARHGEEAVKLDAPDSPQIIKWLKNHMAYGRERILCLVDRGQMDFIAPLREDWKAEVTATVPEQLDADIIWCEWAGAECVKLTHRDWESGKPRIIVRIHGYELYSGALSEINWRAVDDVIFVADWLKEEALAQYPMMEAHANVYVVPGGVQTDKFTISEQKTGKKLSMLGYLNARKNLPLALQIMALLPKEYELHLAGEWQDAELLAYVEQMVDEMGLTGRVFSYGRVPDANAWFADKDFILSTGIRETFHYALAEGMAAGLKPIIHSWRGVGEFYQEQWKFRTIEEAAAIILAGSGEPNEWRQYACEYLDVSRNKRRIERIIAHPSVRVCGEPKYPHATEYKFMTLLEHLGCRVDAPNPELVLLMGTHPQVEDWMRDAKRVVMWVDDKVGKAERDIEGAEWRKRAYSDVDLVIAQNPHWVKTLYAEGAKHVQHIPLLGAVYPYHPVEVEKKYDVGFYGCITERRKPILTMLAKEFDITICEEYNHEKLNEFINQCRVIVHIHPYDDPRLVWRLYDPLAAGVPVVSEPLAKGHHLTGRILEYPTERLAVGLRKALKSPGDAKLRSNWIWEHLPAMRQLEKLLEAVKL